MIESENPVREVAAADICFEWTLNFYDNILSGLCRWNGKPHYFQTVRDWGEPDYSYSYYLYELTEEEYEKECWFAQLFYDLVCNHWKMDGTWKRTPISEWWVAPQKEWCKYYEHPEVVGRKKQEYWLREPVGRFNPWGSPPNPR